MVFVGEEHLIGQFILAFNFLIKPFKWCFSIIPVLPIALLDMLDAPVPLIAGITKKEFQMIMEDEILDCELESILWINLSLRKDDLGNDLPIFI